MKPRRKKPADKQWCAPEHCKRDCSWKGEKLASTNYGGKVRRKAVASVRPDDCGASYKEAVLVQTPERRAKRYMKNGIIMEVRY